MSKHSITLVRDGVRGFLSNQSIGTDALNALREIPGVINPEIISESNEQVQLEYTWAGREAFDKTDEHLLRFGLRRI